MLPRHAGDLRFQIECSPFSETVAFVVGNDTVVADSAGNQTVEFDCVFSGAEAANPGFRLVPLGDGLTGVAVSGLFDNSTERDEGNKAARRKPRVIVFRWPKSARADTAVIVREQEFKVTSFERDANLGMVVWLR
jgi:hypothetical protein